MLMLYMRATIFHKKQIIKIRNQIISEKIAAILKSEPILSLFYLFECIFHGKCKYGNEYLNASICFFNLEILNPSCVPNTGVERVMGGSVCAVGVAPSYIYPNSLPLISKQNTFINIFMNIVT